jgi:hypothetical protein
MRPISSVIGFIHTSVDMTSSNNSITDLVGNRYGGCIDSALIRRASVNRTVTEPKAFV